MTPNTRQLSAERPAPATPSGTPVEPPRLQLKGLQLTYRMPPVKGRIRTINAVRNVDLEVERGKFVCVVGPSGCGKTSLLRAIAGLLKPTGGEVLIDGHPVRPGSKDMAVVFQQDSLMPWRTVRGNVRFGLDVRRQKKAAVADNVQRCIDLVNLHGSESLYPHQLSGGMRQRVNLARALAMDPQVLLMDEPFAALDAQTREVMQSELLQVWQRDRKTVFFVTHQLDEAVFLADEVVVMGAKPGRILRRMTVPFERPRSLSVKRTPEFLAMVEEIWELIEDGVRTAAAGGEE
ncbi:ABC transporter ATP-binding protein [Pseudonocardia ailaonensis]|uniref:ABC transporter ATP-binding protein n=1 Tax=Pseudonocardia ailaonensis TaxID=367279 RepID=A0ABN2N466_9PSEU